ncbi:MAG: hypothetical protein JXA41_13835 [Deltaproteobacteria bacterium]|nr:hypothetical protein [Deltaproteobacteria bacterium]
MTVFFTDPSPLSAERHEESNFTTLWNEQVVKKPDRGTLVARGMIGPARWLKTATRLEHQRNTLAKSPSIYLDTPDDYASEGAKELVTYERDAIKAVAMGDEKNAMMAGGECAQRISDMPKVEDLFNEVIQQRRIF